MRPHSGSYVQPRFLRLFFFTAIAAYNRLDNFAKALSVSNSRIPMGVAWAVVCASCTVSAFFSLSRAGQTVLGLSHNPSAKACARC